MGYSNLNIWKYLRLGIFQKKRDSSETSTINLQIFSQMLYPSSEAVNTVLHANGFCIIKQQKNY